MSTALKGAVVPLTPKPSTGETLQSLAARALAEARKTIGDNASGNDVWPVAAKVLRRLVDGHRELVEDIINRALDKACWDAVTAHDSKTRGNIWRTSGRDSTGGLIAVAGSNLRGLMATPVRDGLLLGNATRTELLSVASEMIHSGRQEMARGLWFQRVANAIGDGIKVKDCLKQSDLESLKARAENEAGL